MMKLFFELFPIILFFVAFKIKGIYFATAVAITASILQIGYMVIRKKPIEAMMWISLAVLCVFGGSTLLLHNELFIKWKPTILYWVFAAIIIVAKVGFRKNIMQILMQKQLQLPKKAWNFINISWASFFLVLGGVNLFVAYRFSTNLWVNFKLFGVLGCFIFFAIIQSLFLAPYIKEDTPSK